MEMESVLSLEEEFYQQGFNAGAPHGQLHGLFEGRALGREKGWELWEEVGYYEGVATFWKAVISANSSTNTRALATIDQLLAMINTFPTTNNSAITSSDIDISSLLTSIRSKYRTLCGSLGVRARMVAASGGGSTSLSL